MQIHKYLFSKTLGEGGASGPGPFWCQLVGIGSSYGYAWETPQMVGGKPPRHINDVQHFGSLTQIDVLGCSWVVNPSSFQWNLTTGRANRLGPQLRLEEADGPLLWLWGR